MSAIEFAPARREGVKARIALIGPPGSGKTLGALKIARAIGGRWFGIDTEHGRMKLYADKFKFEHGNLMDTSPEGYVAALKIAVGSGADGLIFDSVSHEWYSILAEADRFGNWKDLTPRHKAFVEELVSVPAHLIVTMRAKVNYAVEEEEVNGRKRQKITRLGVGPVQREGVEYEFDVIGYLETDSHEAQFLNRCDALVGKTMLVDDAIPPLLTWLAEGEPDPNMERAPDGKVEELRALLRAENVDDIVIEDSLRLAASRTGGILTLGFVEGKIAAAHARAKGEQAAPAAVGNPEVKVPRTWADVNALLESALTAAVVPDFEAFLIEAVEVLYPGKTVERLLGGSVKSNLSRAELATVLQKAAGAAVRLVELMPGDFPPPNRAQMREAFAAVIDHELSGPAWSMGPDDGDRPVRPVDEPAVLPVGPPA